MKKRPENLSDFAINQEAERLFANVHSQRAFVKGCYHVLLALGYDKPK